MSLPLCLAPWLGGLRHLLPHLWSNLALLQSCSTSRPLCVPRCPLPPSPTGSQLRPSQLIALLKQVDHKPFANNSPAPGCRVECDHCQSHESHDKGNQNTPGTQSPHDRNSERKQTCAPAPSSSVCSTGSRRLPGTPGTPRDTARSPVWTRKRSHIAT